MAAQERASLASRAEALAAGRRATAIACRRPVALL